MPRQQLRQRGTALISVLSIVTILLMFGAVAANMVSRSASNTQEKFRRDSQAANIARAGMRDAIGWFKRKSSISGPVGYPTPYDTDHPCADAAFNPAYHEDPKLRETIDSDVGIVKDLLLDEERRLYGRYIVRKQPCTDPTGDILPNMDGYQRMAAHDITEERGKGDRGEGYVWHLVSEGIVYQRFNQARNADGVFTTGPETPPNRILDRSYVESDINRISLRKPMAPINVIDPLLGNVSQSQFNDKCEVRGRDASAMLYYINGGGGTNPNGTPLCQFESCSGNAGQKKERNPDTDPMSLDEVFSVSKDELKSISDYVYTSVSDMKDAHYQPSAGRMNLPLAIYYLDGNFTFNTTNQLRGSGILFVNGNLNLQADSFAFSGLVYVTGKLTMGDNNEIAGSALASEIDCRPSIKTSFEYNAGILETVRDKLALYRENTLSFTTNR